jgi:hypothetical protein
MYYRIKSAIGGDTVYLSLNSNTSNGPLILNDFYGDDNPQLRDSQLWQAVAWINTNNTYMGVALINKQSGMMAYSAGSNDSPVTMVSAAQGPVDGVRWNLGADSAISLTSTGGSQNLNVKDNQDVITYEWQSDPIGSNEQWTWEQADAN